MTLTNRLSLYFLLMLAAVLASFSTGLYLLAHVHLHRQVEERLAAVLNTLAAAVEVGRDGVEWEAGERQLAFGSGAFGDQVVWRVSDDRGRLVDRSAPPAAEALLVEVTRLPQTSPRATEEFAWQGEWWQVSHQRLAPPDTSPVTPPSDDRKHAALILTAGVPLQPIATALRQLAAVLIGLSLAVWLLAWLVGRAVCRRALLPVRRMAARARDMDADDLGSRLSGAGTGDALDDLSRAFNNLLDRLQESVQRQQRFTGDASHQLRTPLTVILGQIEVALRRKRSIEEYEWVLNLVHQKAEHLRRIVESLFFLARADAEARLPDRERIDLQEWLPTHLRSWAEHARAGDLMVETAGAAAAWVEAQPILLGELVNLLIDNACKYTPPRTPITLRLRHDESGVELSVSDEGCGIPDDEQRHLFAPFFRAAESRRRGIEGLGLGLAIAQRLAHAFNGTLSVASRSGQGSCFTLRLPNAEWAWVESTDGAVISHRGPD